MYEPRVIEIKKPFSLRGTPAGKFNKIVNLILLVVPFVGLSSLSWFMIKKRRIIDELDGNCYIKEEDMIPYSLWNKPPWSLDQFVNIDPEIRKEEELRAPEMGSYSKL